MTNLFSIFKRETSAYFISAIAYIFITVFILLNCGLFMTQFFLIGRADMRSFFVTLPFILSVFIPAISMRLWAEEKRGNTLEMLLTFPMATHELVLGKFLAGLVFYVTALAGTLTLPLMLFMLGRPDLGAIAGGYVGAILIGAFFLALGIFVSGLCRDQIVAFIISMMACFSIYFVGTEFISGSIDGWVPGLGSILKEFVGTARHFDAFAKGVIDSSDLLYFLLGTILFLVLNGFWLEGRMRPKASQVFTSAVLICAGIFVMGNWFLSGLPIGRFDLTEGKVYTVSDSSKKILGNLKAPVTAKLYISPEEKLPTGMKSLERDVLGKLEEFRVASAGKFQYKVFHLETTNVMQMQAGEVKESLEAQVSQKGIQPFQVQSIEADEVGVKLVYSSLSLSYKENPEEIIPRIMPENLQELEYLLISKIYRMTFDEKPKVALVAPYQEKTMDPQMQMLLAQLGGGQAPGGYREDDYELMQLLLAQEGYEVARIRLTEKEPIPEGTKTLVIAEPQNFSERQLYEISKFLRSGGSVFLAVQNYLYDYQPTPSGQLNIIAQEKKPGVNPLLQAWGFEVDNDILLDEQHEVVSIGGGARLGPFAIPIPVKLPTQVVVTPSGMNPDISITSRLSSLFYLWGTALKIDDAKVTSQGLHVTTLLESSEGSFTVVFNPRLSPQYFATALEKSHGPLPLAIFAKGVFNDAYAGKSVPAWSGTTEAADAKPAEPVKPAPGKLVLVGASTMFQKQIAQSGGHLAFFLNSIDVMTLGDELVNIRSKRPIDRSIGLISTPVKLTWRIVVSVGIPALMIVIGVFRGAIRRRTKNEYLKSLSQESSV